MGETFADRTAPAPAEIETLAAEVFATIPEVLRGKARDVVIRVTDFPDRATEEDMKLASPFDILGLYCGVPMSDKSVSDPVRDVDVIYLYRRPLLDYWCETGEELAHLVRHVLIHEIGHHFGFSDDDMARIEQEAETEGKERSR